MKLSQTSGVPIYQQIADQFKEEILNGKYSDGEYLPSIRGLAKDLKKKTHGRARNLGSHKIYFYNYFSIKLIASDYQF